MCLTLPGEGFSAYVAEGGFHRVGLRSGRRPIRPGLAVAAALLTLTLPLTRTTRLALALTTTRAAGARARATGAPSSATAAVLSHWRRLQIIGFRRLAGLSVEQLRLHGRA